MSNIYHLLYRPAALEKEEMILELEQLAIELLRSGRFRVDAEERMNFVRFQRPYTGINLMFSERELFDKRLLPNTKRHLTQLLSYTDGRSDIAEKVEKEIRYLRGLTKRYVRLDLSVEMKLARLVVQATEPIVIKRLLLENGEIFVSYSHTVGDMLDIQSWQAVGTSSGLQSTAGRSSTVFISCGGDPFRPQSDSEMYGDGLPAINRLIVIGAQELGHYADVMIDREGRKFSRHSADLYGRRAKEHVRVGRLKDMAQLEQLNLLLTRLGLYKLVEAETHLKFYRRFKTYSPLGLFTLALVVNRRNRLIRKLKHAKLEVILTIPYHEYYGTRIKQCIEDMQFNLAPKADAYERADPVEEEAIACIEALARVPQQMVKWGHRMTKRAMPNLYHVYYHEVIPDVIRSYEQLTHTKYSPTLTKPMFSPWYWFKKHILYREKKPKKTSS